TGCPGSAGVPQFAINQQPRVGCPFSLVLSNLPDNQFAAAVFGSDLTSLPGPIRELSALGMPGCYQYTSVDIADIIPSSGVFGVYVWGTILANDPRLVGLMFTMQFVVGDPTANPAGLICTRGGVAAIGP